MSEQSDEELVRAYQAGDEVAYATFVSRHENRIFRMAVVWLQDASLAGDVLQETLYRSYTGLSRFRFRASPSTWLLRICRNVCHEENRRSARQAPLPDDYSGEAYTPCFDTDRARAVTVRHVWEVLGELPERQREVVTLRLLEELSVAQTAHIMGCRPGTVKAHLSKALASMKKRMDVGDGEDDG